MRLCPAEELSITVLQPPPNRLFNEQRRRDGTEIMERKDGISPTSGFSPTRICTVSSAGRCRSCRLPVWWYQEWALVVRPGTTVLVPHAGPHALPGAPGICGMDVRKKGIPVSHRGRQGEPQQLSVRVCAVHLPCALPTVCTTTRFYGGQLWQDVTDSVLVGWPPHAAACLLPHLPGKVAASVPRWPSCQMRTPLSNNPPLAKSRLLCLLLLRCAHLFALAGPSHLFFSMSTTR